MKVINNKFGSGVSDYEGGRTADSIVDYMQKETRPLISEVASLSEIANSEKPNFLFVGAVTEEIKKLASAKKKYMSFYNIAALEGAAEGSLVLVKDSQNADSAAADFEAFTAKHA